MDKNNIKLLDSRDKNRVFLKVLNFFLVTLLLVSCGGGGGGGGAAVNIKPVADAGINQTVTTGELVTLNGGGSSDGDGDSLSYLWTISSKPGGSGVSLSGSTTVSPSFTPDMDGTYIVSLIVHDGTENSTGDNITVTASTPAGGGVNTVPVAQAGSDRNVITNSLVTLDGSGSYDADADTLTFAWALSVSPAGSSASLSGSTSESPTFTPDIDGQYVLTLIVNDGTVDSSQASVTLTAITPTGSVILPATGQTISYYGGDDGELQSGIAWPVPRFTDNGDGTVTDHLTGLMWLKNADCIKTEYSSFDTENLNGYAGDGKVSWQLALDFVAGVNSGTYANCGAGYGDWHLPNRSELRSLVDYSKSITPLPSGHPFINVRLGDYWSSTSDPDYPSDAAALDTYEGYVHHSGKWLDYYVWPVRVSSETPPAQIPVTGQTLCYDESGNIIGCSGTGQDGDVLSGVTWPASRLVDNGNGTVTDKLTGLVWLKDARCIKSTYPDYDNYTTDYNTVGNGGVTWQYALDFVAGMNSGLYPDCGMGYSDWRLPNANELMSLENAGESDLVLWLNQVFNNVTGGTYWTSTTSADYTVNAWYAGLNSYYVIFSDNKPFERNVWPVRDTTESNYPPIAYAGDDQYVILGATANLAGDGYDSQSPSLGYNWSIVSSPVGSVAALSNVTSQNPTFLPDKPGKYEFALTVSDGEFSSSPDIVNIFANTINCTFDNEITVGTSAKLATAGISRGFVPLCDGWLLYGDQSTNKVVLSNVFTGDTYQDFQLSLQPELLEYDDVNNMLFVTQNASTDLLRIDMESAAFDVISLTSTPLDMTIGNDGKVFLSLYNASQFDYNTIALVDGIAGNQLNTWTPDTMYKDLLLTYDKVGNQLITGETYVNPTTLMRFSFYTSTNTLTFTEEVASSSSGSDLAVSPDGNHIAYPCGAGNQTSGTPYTVADYDANDLTQTFGEWDTSAYPLSAVFSPDGNYLVATNTFKLQLFDVATHALVNEFTPTFECGFNSSDILKVGISRGGTILFIYADCGSGNGSFFVQTFTP